MLFNQVYNNTVIIKNHIVKRNMQANKMFLKCLKCLIKKMVSTHHFWLLVPLAVRNFCQAVAIEI